MDTDEKIITQYKLINDNFDNYHWRKIINETCHGIDTSNLNISAISPFGFELLEKKKYLSKKLRRFYIYIGIANNTEIGKNKVISIFEKKFLKQLSVIDSRMLDDIVVIVKNDLLTKLRNTNYICKPTDKLLDIQVRHVKTDILTDYAEYIIASLSGIHLEKGEGSEFKTNIMWRWRLYQLYIMQENIFGHLLPPMSRLELQNYLKIFGITSNCIQFFFEPNNMFIPPSREENEIIYKLIKPRVAEMLNIIKPKSPETRVKIECEAYHQYDLLHIELDQEYYSDAIDKIRETYLQFT